MRRGRSKFVLHVRWPEGAPLTGVDRLRVEHTLFDRVQLGGSVRVVLHSGALGVPWIESIDAP